jgi:archaellum component FlaC
MFKQGNTFGKGRVKGSKNKLVNREGAVQLLDTIIKDLNTNYELLTIEDKLRILSTFKQLYNFEFINEMDEVTEIKVHIIPPLVTN